MQQIMPIIKINGFFEFIEPDVLDKRLKAGTARKLGDMPTAYEEVTPPPPPVKAPTPMAPPPDLDSIVDEDPPPSADRQTYQTADLKPEPRRRRGRPRKQAPLPPAAADAE